MKVRKELLSMVAACAAKYKNEPGMHVLRDLYDSGRSKLGVGPVRHILPKSLLLVALTDFGHGKAKQRSRSGSVGASAQPRRSPEATPTMPPRPVQTTPPPMKQPKRMSMPPSNSPPPTKTKPRSSSTAGANRRFDLEAAKPKIIQEVALANQNWNNLVNALKFINTSEDRWEIDLQHDARLQDYKQRCEESKKKIVRYARLVEDEEWIGTLLATNEELLRALEMYETMAVGEVPLHIPATTTSPSPPPQSPSQPSSPHTRSPPPPPVRPYDDSTSSAVQDLAGLRLSSPQAASSGQENDPFADPFADPVEESHDSNKRRG